MANGFAQATVFGRVGQVPVLEYVGKEGEKIARCRFSIAVDRNAPMDAPTDFQPVTDWINIIAWRGRAETLAKYVGRGHQVLVQGNMHNNNYTNPETGLTRYSTEIHVTGFNLVDNRGMGSGSSLVGEEIDFNDGDSAESQPALLEE
jgi:single-strand DNA-binding protein